jgi:glycosyltransferase involved in cell wall biosynthesis
LKSRDQGRQVEDLRSPSALADRDDVTGGAASGRGGTVLAASGSRNLSEYIAPHFVTQGLAEWVPQPHPVTVVIPARNEEKCLPYVLSRIPPWVHEVILVDGASVDATIEVARHHWPSIRIIRQTGKGKGAALRQGFSHSTGDLIVAIDADGSMDPAEMGVFVSLLALGFDYVKGSRMLPEGGSCDLTTLRRLGNWAFRTLTNVIHRSRYTDLCYGYFAFRRGTVDALPLRSDDFAIETEINIKAWKAGLRVIEVPSREFDRIDGRSALRPLGDGWRILSAILRERFSRSPQLRANGDLSLLQPSPVVVDRNESSE